MISAKVKTCIVLAPHTDDGEFGCGATIARLIEQGTNVYYMTFSICEESVPEGFQRDALNKEVLEATRRLGIPSANVTVHKYKVRYFQNSRQEILQHLYDFNQKHSPELVFCPASDDIHQDHQVINQEAVRAFKNSTILGYELPWNNRHFKTDVYIKVTKENIIKKIDVLQSYVTQKNRTYMNEEYLRGVLIMRGTQSGLGYAEAFEGIRMKMSF